MKIVKGNDLRIGVIGKIGKEEEVQERSFDKDLAGLPSSKTI